MNSPARAQRHGFSVVELLAALAVLSVLALLSVMSLRSITMRTRQANSAATMRGIGAALAHYVADHGELPGKSHTLNPPYFAVSNKLITHIWPYLGRSRRPDDKEILPEYVPPHMMAWLRANHNPSASGGQDDPILYRLGNPPSFEGTAYTLWGYPGVDEQRTRWNTLVALFPLSRVEALHDIRRSDVKGVPKFGEIQNYTTTLYLDWHVEITRP